ncbi:FAD-dependent oxidoreductase [Streptomyces sp. BG9H]|uniref:FAD-dependent oxidoreductase n=1 Tax=Streptomyces anatolicus TaxID=2675858 RepID=A0ABS6YVV0_9ACTN|nr:FAD-dependent oxidoreductase [Streptomyces anatolicus]MBW5425534.1 FAD-dependent oxidoreductase [Streptomyces anatolicus]
MSVDVAVAGNGVLGLSIAVELARRSPGLRVAVAGPAARPGAATVAAGAMLNCFAEVTDRVGAHPASRTKFALARAALDAWPDWLEGLRDGGRGRGPELVSPGTFVVLGARATPTATRNFDAVHAALKEYAEPHHEVEAADIPGLRPVPHERPVRALYLEREGAVDARAVLDALEDTGRRLGVTFLDGQASELLSAHGKVTGMRLEDGTELAAGAVVVAAGAASHTLLRQPLPDRTPPLLHGTGLAVRTARQAPPGFDRVIRTPTRSGACGMHLVPLGGGQEYIGATNIVLFDPPPGPRIGVTQSLLRFATDQFDTRLGMSAVQEWHYGSRPVPLDCFPLLGPAAGTDGLFVATGTYRDGLHSSPVIARHLTDMILGPGTTPELLEPFAPVRAPIETMTVEACVELSVSDAVETATEYGMRMPYFLDTEPVAAHARDEARRALERLAQPVALAPEILAAVGEASAPHIERLNTYLRQLRRAGPPV